MTEISLREISRGIKLPDLSGIPYEDGAMPVAHFPAFMAILIKSAPTTVLEIGTFNGSTTRAMAEALPNAIIHTLDLPLDTDVSKFPPVPGSDTHLIARRTVGRAFRHHPVQSRIRQHYGDSRTWDFSVVGRPDFFFIDGCHTYEGCKNDSEKCLDLCGASDAMFVWHDNDRDHPGVVRLIEEWRILGRDIIRISGTSLAYWSFAIGY